MSEQPKWDLADDVVLYEPRSLQVTRGHRVKSKVMKVTTSAALGAVILAGGFLLSSTASTLRVEVVGTSRPIQLSEEIRYVRPRGKRSLDPLASVDTQEGMSTRRLADLHRKLFSVDTSVEEELTGEYAFL